MLKNYTKIAYGFGFGISMLAIFIPWWYPSFPIPIARKGFLSGLVLIIVSLIIRLCMARRRKKESLKPIIEGGPFQVFLERKKAEGEELNKTHLLPQNYKDWRESVVFEIKKELGDAQAKRFGDLVDIKDMNFFPENERHKLLEKQISHLKILIKNYTALH